MFTGIWISLWVLMTIAEYVVLQNLPYKWTVCMSDEEFQQLCRSYNGAAVSGRCFFMSDDRKIGNNAFQKAWTICDYYNATLAQIQTSEELAKIYSTIPNNVFSPWIALYRVVKNKDGDLAIVPDKTFWLYSPADITSPNPALSVANTWALARQKDDQTLNGDGGCFTIELDSSRKLMDLVCDRSQPALCQITNIAQAYELVSDFCVASGVFKTLTNTNEQGCADACSQDLACRSFNVLGGTACELSTWSFADSPAMSTKANCVYFKQIA